MSELRSRRGSPDAFEFEGAGDEARRWLDAAYGTTLRLVGDLGTVRHHREDHGSVAFDHLTIETDFSFDADPMPVLVVMDVFGGTSEYTRGGVTDVVHDGDSVIMAGWNMPFSGRSSQLEVRGTTLTGEALEAAVDAVAPGYPWRRVVFTSYVPHSPAAGARWRATVDQLVASFPGADDPEARLDAVRLLGHTLFSTFPNNLVAAERSLESYDAWAEGAPATLRRAVAIIEERAFDDLSLAELAEECGVTPRTLQYAFRKHLGCTPLAYLRRVRLDLVRQALRDGSAQTVGDAAARNGFFNPGRFAADYRQVFQENPGQTLSRSTS